MGKEEVSSGLKLGLTAVNVLLIHGTHIPYPI